MARRSPVEVDARRLALRDLLADRKHRGNRDAGELLTSTADGLAREAAYEVNAGNLPEARRYARAYQLITESRRRLAARRERDREAEHERQAAVHGIKEGETVRVVRRAAGSDVPVGTVLTVDRVRGAALFSDHGDRTRFLWARDVERIVYAVEPETWPMSHVEDPADYPDPEAFGTSDDEPETATCPSCGRDHVPDEHEGSLHDTCVECLDGNGDNQ